MAPLDPDLRALQEVRDQVARARAAADVVRGSLVEIAEVLLAGLYSGAIVWCQKQLFFKGENGWFSDEKTKIVCVTTLQSLNFKCVERFV